MDRLGRPHIPPTEVLIHRHGRHTRRETGVHHDTDDIIQQTDSIGRNVGGGIDSRSDDNSPR